jgi:hypothetical protein
MGEYTSLSVNIARVSFPLREKISFLLNDFVVGKGKMIKVIQEATGHWDTVSIVRVKFAQYISESFLLLKFLNNCPSVRCA